MSPALLGWKTCYPRVPLGRAVVSVPDGCYLFGVLKPAVKPLAIKLLKYKYRVCVPIVRVYIHTYISAHKGSSILSI